MVIQAALTGFRMEHTLDISLVDILLFKGQLFKEYSTLLVFLVFFFCLGIESIKLQLINFCLKPLRD